MMTLDALSPNYFTILDADHPAFRYVGRIDQTDPKAPVLIYPGSYIEVFFSGDSIAFRIEDDGKGGGNYVGYLIDGKEGSFFCRLREKDAVYIAQEDLQPGWHKLTLFKRTDGCHGYIVFKGICLPKGGQISPVPAPARRIECYGDSVTAGCVNMTYGIERLLDGPNQGEYDNAWYSYAAILARKLGADIHNNAQGGTSLLDGYGFFDNGEGLVGMERMYTMMGYVAYCGPCTAWDFSRYSPQVVTIGIGQNDGSTYADIAADPKAKENWKAHYKAVLKGLRTQHPDAYILLFTTVLMHAPIWDDVLFEIAEEMQDDRIIAYRVRGAGQITPGHPRRREMEAQAEDLYQWIQTLPIPW